MKKTKIIHLRIDREIDELLIKVSSNLGLDKSALTRMLLLRSLKQLNADALKFGWENLDFIIKRD